MNKWQKLVQQQFLNNEEAVIGRLEDIYGKAQEDIEKKLNKLTFDIGKLQTEYDWLDPDDPEKARIKSIIQSKIYQKSYQEQLKKQVDGILGQMQTSQFTTISDYLDECYNDGFIGTIFDQHGQGVPITTPINQAAMVRAVQLDSKISQGLYTKLGVDVALLKKKITAEVSRSISTGKSFKETAQLLANQSRIGYNKAIRIARTEGHRIQTTATKDCMVAAKERGADIVKQWDATLDGGTRESHVAVDGEIRELDEPFSNGLDRPGDPSGPAAEVINCRCALLQRARWAVEGEDKSFTKFNNFTKQVESFESPEKYSDFKKAFFSKENKEYMSFVEDMQDKYSTKDFAKLLDSLSDQEYQHYSTLLANNPIYNKPAKKPKKEYLTEKKLEQLISDGNVQLDDLKKQFLAAAEYDYDDFVKDYNGSIEEAYDGLEEAKKMHDLKKQMADMESKYGGEDEFWALSTEKEQELYGELDEEYYDLVKVLSNKGTKLSDFGTAEEVDKFYDQMKAAKAIKKQIDDIEGTVSDYQEKLNKKLTAKEIKKLKKEEILLQDELDGIDIKTYSGIWKNDVTTADWHNLNIEGKKKYYESKFITETDPDKLKMYQDYYNQLLELETEGKKYYEISQKLSKTKKDLTNLQKNGIISAKNSDLDAFTQDRKDNAYWFTDKNGSVKAADGVLRDKAGEVWRGASTLEKDSIYEYTRSYHKYNEPLRGIEYGTNKFLGVGNVDLDQIGVTYGGYRPGQIHKEIDAITSIIDKSEYDFDMWLQRGCRRSGMDKFFGIDMSDFDLSEAELSALLVGKTPTEFAFMSTGVAKGKGLNTSGGVLLNIYAPKGTKMMYIEPISAFGNGAKRSWDGISQQSYFGHEAEMLVQRGTKFRVTKVTKSNGTIYVDLEVIEQGVN